MLYFLEIRKRCFWCCGMHKGKKQPFKNVILTLYYHFLWWCDLICFMSVVTDCFTVNFFLNKKLYSNNSKAQWGVQSKPFAVHMIKSSDDFINRSHNTNTSVSAIPLKPSDHSVGRKKKKKNHDTGFAELPWPNLSCGLLGF